MNRLSRPKHFYFRSRGSRGGARDDFLAEQDDCTTDLAAGRTGLDPGRQTNEARRRRFFFNLDDAASQSVARSDSGGAFRRASRAGGTRRRGGGDEKRTNERGVFFTRREARRVAAGAAATESVEDGDDFAEIPRPRAEGPDGPSAAARRADARFVPSVLFFAFEIFFANDTERTDRRVRREKRYRITTVHRAKNRTSARTHVGPHYTTPLTKNEKKKASAAKKKRRYHGTYATANASLPFQKPRVITFCSVPPTPPPLCRRS